jgi:glycosyltransferase involved in cell wall biosynthesis
MQDHKNLIIIQPALPSYRHEFFDRLARSPGQRVRVWYSAAQMGVLTSEASRPEWASELPVRLRAFGAEWQPGAFKIPMKKGDVVVLPGAPRCLSYMVLFLKARLVGARTIWWGHFWSSTSRRWRLALRVKMMAISDLCLFYTDAEVQEYTAAQGAWGRRPALALNNGINIAPIETVRAPYRAHDRSSAVFFIGRLERKARLDLLLQALAFPCLKHVRLNIVGDGSIGDVLRAQAEELGVANRVRWHGGTTDERQISAAANEAKVFVYPGEVGLSLIHGMAYGLPALVHSDRWTHMPEIAAFKEGQTGLAFAPGDVASLAATLSKMMKAEDELDRYSSACLRTVFTRCA